MPLYWMDLETEPRGSLDCIELFQTFRSREELRANVSESQQRLPKPEVAFWVSGFLFVCGVCLLVWVVLVLVFAFWRFLD